MPPAIVLVVMDTSRIPPAAFHRLGYKCPPPRSTAAPSPSVGAADGGGGDDGLPPRAGSAGSSGAASALQTPSGLSSFSPVFTAPLEVDARHTQRLWPSVVGLVQHSEKRARSGELTRAWLGAGSDVDVSVAAWVTPTAHARSRSCAHMSAH